MAKQDPVGDVWAQNDYIERNRIRFIHHIDDAFEYYCTVHVTPPQGSVRNTMILTKQTETIVIHNTVEDSTIQDIVKYRTVALYKEQKTYM
ncbi:Hypothetical predicted protein [Mytilus galloprovincialis]|uniref:Uncharacterized protein n=1 Tax=Mytilus galloprovincialis TaxID=29158 RepID=A0A8B6CIK8_MYTGA|nr:Hypothetical predicted protein [Mytilus galloprovincialis]